MLPRMQQINVKEIVKEYRDEGVCGEEEALLDPRDPFGWSNNQTDMRWVNKRK